VAASRGALVNLRKPFAPPCTPETKQLHQPNHVWILRKSANYIIA